jgi:hypothetical protein
MTYKFEMFIVEDQDIITRKRVNNVFFFELWKHVNYNFVITFIVDNFEQIFQIVNLDFVVFESIYSLIFNEQSNLEHLTRSIKASEKAKRASINENVEKNESYQIDCR